MTIQSIKTALLLTVLSFLVIFFGGLIGGTAGIHVALVCALAMNVVAYLWSDVIVLNMYRAHPLDEKAHAPLVAMVKDLADTMCIPMPRLWIIESSMANAFATGRSPRYASVALTSGIIKILPPHALKGVLAHELAHIKNRDILISTIAATMATAISYCAHMAQYRIAYGMSSERKQKNTIGIIVGALLLPIAATLLQLALSRSREFAADETAARTTGDPLALAVALETLHAHVSAADEYNSKAYAGTASLFIVHPFSAEDVASLFSTHPPIHKRIENLHRLAHDLSSTR